LYWVQDRCYRRNPCKNVHNFTKSDVENSKTPEQVVQLAPYQELEEMDNNMDCDPFAPDELDDRVSYRIEKIENGYKTKIDTIPCSLFPQIIGGKGATKKRIESETNTKIIVPRQNEKGDIVVRGQKEKDVVNCRRRLENIASQARFKKEATHFICFPLNAPHVVEKFREFKQLVLNEVGSSCNGLEESIFQEPEKVHFTICVMVLLDERERELCTEILNKLKEEIREKLNQHQLKIRLKGLECMNDDPSAVNVLYAKCDKQSDDLNCIQQIADMIALKYAESGFSKGAYGESVKLHCTILNTRYRSDNKVVPEQSGGWRKEGREVNRTFDAYPILNKFEDFFFGEVELDQIQMATRHTKGTDGFYKSYSKISL